MAIIEAVPHVSVQILVNGTPVPEFDDDSNSNNDISCSISKYVEVTPGDSFSIQYHMKPAFVPKHDVLVELYVDGKYGDSYVPAAADILRSGGLLSMFKGIRESTSTGQFLRKLVFSAVTTNESRLAAPSDDLKKTLEQVGTISVKFLWVIKQGHSANQTRDTKNFTKLGAIPEKALKGRALSTQTDLGPREPTPKFTFVTADRLYDGKPFAEFNFIYRSRKDLKSLLLIPRSPSPVPLEDRDVDSLNPEEMRSCLDDSKCVADPWLLADGGALTPSSGAAGGC